MKKKMKKVIKKIGHKDKVLIQGKIVTIKMRIIKNLKVILNQVSVVHIGIE